MQTLYYKSGSRKKFTIKDKKLYTPFASKDIQYLTYNLFDKMFNVTLCKKQGILDKIVLLHNTKEREAVL